MLSLPLKRTGRCWHATKNSPSGDELGAEFEKFLAQHAEDFKEGFNDSGET